MSSKHYHFKFNFDHDKEIIDRIESKENKNDYIRSLILSDIAADALLGSIKLEEVKESFDCGNTNDVHEPVTHDVESFDPDENEYNERVDFYYDNCPALNNLDVSKNHCEGCEFHTHYMDIDKIERTSCSLEDAWRTHLIHKRYDHRMEEKSDG